MFIYLNGQYLDEESATTPISDAGFLFGHGVYETLRTYNGQLKYVHEHFERLKISARSLQIPMPIAKAELDTVLEDLVQKNCCFKGDDLRIRITLTAGSANFVVNKAGQPTILITAKAIKNDELKPLTMVSYKIARTAPEIKSTSMIANILAQQYAHKKGADEALLVGTDNYTREGSFCNIFAVKSGKLITPAKYILGGITRSIVLHVASNLMPTDEREVSLSEFFGADEMFITSTVRGVVPVAILDEHVFKVPGTFTKKIQDLYKLKTFGSV